jgi:hypothetical protein
VWERLVAWLEVLAVPDYEFICHPCKLVWDKEYSMKNAPARSRCPECNKLSHQNWSNKQTAVHFIGECHTNKRFIEKSYTNQSDLKKLGEAMIKKTKESVEDSKTHEFYSRYVPNENFQKTYGGIKIEGREREERDRRAASIANTVNKLGSHHIKNGKHIERRNEAKKD